MISDPRAQLLSDLAALSKDPLKFVLWAFPWGEPGTPLENRTGPEPWQVEHLAALRDELSKPNRAIRLAIVSGNGIGKTACVSWIILWAMSTFADTKGVVTANTETQLKTKTWAELGKWYNLFIARDHFKLTATALISADPNHERTWRVDQIPWSEHNVVAFQGLHNEGKRLFMIYDEASGIPDPIWDAGDGCMTDAGTERIWCVYGNPNKPTGRFRTCFPGGSRASQWIPLNVDSRQVSFTDKNEIAQWISLYGEDSDFVRVRVRGVFPRSGSMEFIPATLAIEASQREPDVHLHDPLVIGVDVARFGDDESVIYIRKGRDGRSHPLIRLRGVDTMTLAGRVAEEYMRFRADALFVDGGGVGGGVVDRLRQLQIPVWDIQFGAKSDRANFEDQTRYANKRAEMWGYMREWLKGGAIIDDAELIAQLSAPMYSFNGNNEILLEPKEAIKKRMGSAGTWSSPDIADALALTFAYPVMSHSMAGRDGAELRLGSLVKSEYNPFDEKFLAA